MLSGQERCSSAALERPVITRIVVSLLEESKYICITSGVFDQWVDFCHKQTQELFVLASVGQDKETQKFSLEIQKSPPVNKLQGVIFLFSLLTHAAVSFSYLRSSPDTVLKSQTFTTGNHRSEVASR